MTTVEDNVPAFSTWKMFNDTVPVMMKGECSEASVEKLATLIKEFSNIFICNKDSTLTFEQYQEIGDRYKAFTTWLLGQFFYLLGCEKFSKLHTVIVDAQLCILEQLSKTQLNVYQELSDNYSEAFLLLTNFLKNTGDKLVLKLFIPQIFEDLSSKLDLTQVFIEVSTPEKSFMILSNLMRFIHFFLLENFMYYSFNEYSYINLDSLLFILENCSELMKLHVIEIFLDLLKKPRHKFDEYNYEMQSKMYQFCSLFEQFVQKIYDKHIYLEPPVLEKFEILLISYLEFDSHCGFIRNIESLNRYIFKQSTHFNPLPSELVQLTVIKNMKKIGFNNSGLIVHIPKATSFSNTVLIYCFEDQIYRDIYEVGGNTLGVNAFENASSPTWSVLYLRIIDNLKKLKCEKGNSCKLKEFFKFFKSLSAMLYRIKLKITKYKNKCYSLHFFEEKELLLHFLTIFLEHANKCDQNELLQETFSFFKMFIVLTDSQNLNIIFNFLAYPLLKVFCYKNENQFTDNFIGDGPIGSVKSAIRSFYQFLSLQTITNSVALQNVKEFFDIVSSGHVSLNISHVKNLETTYTKICKNVLESLYLQDIFMIIETIPQLLTLFEDVDSIITNIWNLICSNQNRQIVEKTISEIPKIICCMSAPFMKVLECKKYTSDFFLNVCCQKCFFGDCNDSKILREIMEQKFGKEISGVNFPRIRCESTVISSTLKYILTFISAGSPDLKVNCLQCLPCISNHVTEFHSVNVAKIWVQLAGDSNQEVRKKFAQVVGQIFNHCQENKVLSQEMKSQIFEVILSTLLNLSKDSLKHSYFDLQYTILCAIEELTAKLSDQQVLEISKILLYFVMVPTSKHSLIAVNKFFQLAKRNGTSATSIYSQNKKEMCKVIIHLCSVNYILLKYSLSTSLEKVSLMLGFYNSRDFATQESNYLLPFLIAQINKLPAVDKLVQEMAVLMEMDISEMLSSNYGHIFIHTFLEEPKADFKRCMTYLENITGCSGPSLRKRNFRIILNELLLSFHERNDNVVLALSLLSNEDTENKSTSIAEYLQPHLLGVLLYFDLKLMSKNAGKDKFLLSLADLLRYIGPKHITPLRFKIIAMLQTTNYCNFPELNIEIWNALIHTCEIESLAPQLALIFISILPLLDHCSRRVKDIFKYLVIENEVHMVQYIPDLFFLNSVEVDRGVMMVVKKYLKPLEKQSLRDKIQRFLKYLKHEAMEVRIHALKHLKGYLEHSREELDKMILDYNGIDPTIVDLIDILTMGCREKDEALKLACGQVLGELGAIEPSHFPRTYSQKNSSFSFYMDEDIFIVSSLNELIQALQIDKNTQSMDRYALAIQEILKEYEISSDSTSSKHYLWNEFSDAHKEVMLPLLSSRYMIAQPVIANNLPTPIYGTNYGASFHSWLYNWTCSLISSLPNERKVLLKVFLPSMKINKRVLMHFLPHILLYALLQGTDRISEKSLIEIKTVTSSFTNQSSLDPKVLNNRPILISGLAPPRQQITPEKSKQMQCTKVVFLLLDFLDQWVREWQWQKGLTGSSNEHYKIIEEFQSQFCKLELAKCNYNCGEYPRALMYVEDYISANKKDILTHLPFLAEIYAQLEEPDGVDGVTALQHNEPSAEQRILALEVSGKLADATTCYEQMMQPLKLHHIQGLVQCYLDLDNINTALNFVRGALDSQPEFGNMLLEMQAEPLWRLGQYDELDNFLQRPEMVDNKAWSVQIGKALLCFKNGARDDFQKVLDNLSKQQVLSFGAASLEEGAYQHGYGYISKLHALNELQQLENIVSDLILKPNDQKYVEDLMTKLKNEWLLRIKVVQESVCIVEPLLCLRRVSLNLAKRVLKEKMRAAVPYLDSLIGECWLMSAKTARKAGMHQQAYTYTVKAEEYAPSTLFLEKAKLHWLREEHEQAITTLRRGLTMIMPTDNDFNTIPMEQRKICAEARLLIASYNDAMSNVEAEVNLHDYKKANEVFKEWEKSLVSLAQYYDKMFQNMPLSERDTKGSENQLWIINLFGKSLIYGTTYIYQSMPRLLSVWFDYGTRLLETNHASGRDIRKGCLLQMTKLIDTYLEKLPAYVFLTAFSQLISRICHPQKEVYGELKLIIIKLLQNFPQQSLWMIISVIKSSYSLRSRRCLEILSDSRLKSTMLTKLVRDFTSLAEKLIELCNKEIPPDISTTSVNYLIRSLPRLLSKDDFSEIMMPTFKFRKLILPNPDFSSSEHNPFPNHYVHIVGIDDEVNILQSLQKPRKITLKGSDGKGYIFMLKPKDDLRKDFRLMEFNDIVNHLLTREAEARQRRLNIRLYSVAPLNEECGLIEWVPNMVGLRPVLMALYKQRGLAMTAKELKVTCCQVKDSLDKKRDIFTRKLIPRHPPILGEWFRKTFPDAQSWLTARTAYIRTTAVMSMAGYILGLGDRHGENILLDSTCGDVMHVDFNCLFNKGEKFDFPERVPFRLTHNMVSAMGPLKVEGVFRKSCACTLRVLRMNTNTLMSMVTPFVYDPLVSWHRNVSSLPNIQNSEKTNEEAVDHIKNIELRLQGKIRSRQQTVMMPLSVEGQTNYIINEAISVDNLCQMYIGWGPYL